MSTTPRGVRGLENGRKAEAVGESRWSGFKVLPDETKGSFSSWRPAMLPNGLALLIWAGKPAGSGTLRLGSFITLDDRTDVSSGEKAVSRVSGVPSCLYESPPPLDDSGDDWWKARRSCGCAMTGYLGGEGGLVAVDGGMGEREVTTRLGVGEITFPVETEAGYSPK